jgi:hypothetical protein
MPVQRHALRVSRRSFLKITTAFAGDKDANAWVAREQRRPFGYDFA